MIDIHTTDWQPAPQQLPAGREAFAIGDVHGQADLLQHLLHALPSHRAAFTSDLVFLGDLIDRGPASRECLRLAAATPSWASHVHRLQGNHEQLMTGSLRGLQIAQENWALNGGFDTLRSFGIDVYTTREPINRLKAVLTPAEAALLANLALEARIGPYVFVHAGWHPDVPADQQSDDDRLWIRRAFLEASTWPHPYTVVHGHTSQRPAAHGYRIGVDSKAYRSGVLTAVQLVGSQLRFIQAARSIAADPRYLLHETEVQQ